MSTSKQRPRKIISDIYKKKCDGLRYPENKRRNELDKKSRKETNLWSSAPTSTYKNINLLPTALHVTKSKQEKTNSYCCSICMHTGYYFFLNKLNFPNKTKQMNKCLLLEMGQIFYKAQEFFLKYQPKA